MSHLSAADWAVILIYLLGIIGLGVWFGKDQRNIRDYFLGSKNIPWWGIGLSIVVARIILAVVMVPHYLKGEIYSPYQLFANAFGPATRRTAAALFLLTETLA